MRLRDYQAEAMAEVEYHWAAGARNVLVVSPTGSGKTNMFSYMLSKHEGASCAIAHRHELVGQISLTLGRWGVRHGIIAADSTIRNIVRQHMEELGRSWYEPGAQCRVASVDTLVRMNPSDHWLQRVTLWVQDEAHHLSLDSKGEPNKWAKATGMMPNARGMGVTATPLRADGRGLGRCADGVMDVMVLGPNMRDLINAGFLTDYEIYCPPSDIDLSHVGISASGDFSLEALRDAVKKSHVVGDVVQHYLKIAPGKLGITFAVSIESATDICMEYRAAGVPAEVISSRTDDTLRNTIMRRFKAREIHQIVNVDILGEGVDVPAVEVVSMARPTQSYGLYCLDPETEVLTPDGWKRYNEALSAKEVIAYDMCSGATRISKVEGVVLRALQDDEHMVALESPHLSVCVSNKHDMIVRSMSGTSVNWVKQTAEDVANRQGMFKVPVSGQGDFPGAGLTDHELHFLGWFLSDGNVSSATNAVSISQAVGKVAHINSIRQAIEGCGFKFGYGETVRKNVPTTHQNLARFTVSYGTPRGTDKHLTGWSRLGKWVDKSVPSCYDMLSRQELLTLLHTWNLGDGANNTSSMDWTPRTMRISCGDNEKMADRLQALCVQRGLRANVHSCQMPGKSRWFNVHIKDVGYSTVSGTNVPDGSVSGKKPYVRSKFSKTSYRPPFVWCLTTELGTLITRRQGKVVFLGNCQQFGRALRLAPNKPRAVIIDHASNVLRHGLPDAPRKWSLDRRERRSKSAPSDAVPLRACPECSRPYERVLPECPYCGHEPQPVIRSSPEAVEGDLFQLSPEVLARMRGEVDAAPKFPHGATLEVTGAIKKRWRERQEAQGGLRAAMEQWGGARRAAGDTDRIMQRRFFAQFGVDVLSAQALPRADAAELEQKVRGVL